MSVAIPRPCQSSATANATSAWPGPSGTEQGCAATSLSEPAAGSSPTPCSTRMRAVRAASTPPRKRNHSACSDSPSRNAARAGASDAPVARTCRVEPSRSATSLLVIGMTLLAAPGRGARDVERRDDADRPLAIDDDEMRDVALVHHPHGFVQRRVGLDRMRRGAADELGEAVRVGGGQRPDEVERVDDAPHEVVRGDPADCDSVHAMRRHELRNGLHRRLGPARDDPGGHDIRDRRVAKRGPQVVAAVRLNGLGHGKTDRIRGPVARHPQRSRDRVRANYARSVGAYPTSSVDGNCRWSPPGRLSSSTMEASAAEPAPIRIVLADDHAVVRRGLELLLDAEADFEVVASVGDVDAAIRTTRGYKPDVLVLDLNMPGGSSLEAIPTIREGRPAPPVAPPP